MKNEMTEVGRMRAFFFSVCREHGIDDDTAKTLNLALEEWVANVINYAYPKGMRGHVEVTADVTADVLTLVIKDHGAPFDPTQHEEVDIDADLDERAIGGLGIHLVRTIMDTVEYQRTTDGYNRLVLTKGLKNKS
jgi:sigma-B regulation protein RsbU (phosphoserine phosphatase)